MGSRRPPPSLAALASCAVIVAVAAGKLASSSRDDVADPGLRTSGTKLDRHVALDAARGVLASTLAEVAAVKRRLPGRKPLHARTNLSDVIVFKEKEIRVADAEAYDLSERAGATRREAGRLASLSQEASESARGFAIFVADVPRGSDIEPAEEGQLLKAGLTAQDMILHVLQSTRNTTHFLEDEIASLRSNLRCVAMETEKLQGHLVDASRSLSELRDAKSGALEQASAFLQLKDTTERKAMLSRLGEQLQDQQKLVKQSEKLLAGQHDELMRARKAASVTNDNSSTEPRENAALSNELALLQSDKQSVGQLQREIRVADMKLKGLGKEALHRPSSLLQVESDNPGAAASGAALVLRAGEALLASVDFTSRQLRRATDAEEALLRVLVARAPRTQEARSAPANLGYKLEPQRAALVAALQAHGQKATALAAECRTQEEDFGEVTADLTKGFEELRDEMRRTTTNNKQGGWSGEVRKNHGRLVHGALPEARAVRDDLSVRLEDLSVFLSDLETHAQALQSPQQARDESRGIQGMDMGGIISRLQLELRKAASGTQLLGAKLFAHNETMWKYLLYDEPAEFVALQRYMNLCNRLKQDVDEKLTALVSAQGGLNSTHHAVEQAAANLKVTLRSLGYDPLVADEDEEADDDVVADAALEPERASRGIDLRTDTLLKTLDAELSAARARLSAARAEREYASAELRASFAEVSRGLEELGLAAEGAEVPELPAFRKVLAAGDQALGEVQRDLLDEHHKLEALRGAVNSTTAKVATLLKELDLEGQRLTELRDESGGQDPSLALGQALLDLRRGSAALAAVRGAIDSESRELKRLQDRTPSAGPDRQDADPAVVAEIAKVAAARAKFAPRLKTLRAELNRKTKELAERRLA